MVIQCIFEEDWDAPSGYFAVSAGIKRVNAGISGGLRCCLIAAGEHGAIIEYLLRRKERLDR